MTHKINMLFATTALGTALLASPAWAQAEAEPVADQGVGEIIVTAQKRSQSLDKVPISVDVVSGSAIAAYQESSLKSISQGVPNLTLTSAPSGSIQASIRGFGTAAANAGFEQTVALYVDGVYQPRPQSYTGAVFDVERIEVVKGTQGALFGKNASVGAISLVTKAPGDELGGYVNAGYNFRFQQTRLEAGVDLPLSDRMQLRVAGLFDKANRGWVTNRFTNREEPTSKEFGGRAKLNWDVTDRLTINGKAEFNRFERNGDSFIGVGGTTFAGIEIGDAIKSTTSAFISENNGQGFGTRRSGSHSLGFDWELGDLTLTGITGWQTLKFQTFFDIDYTAGPNDRVFHFDETFRQFTQELRLATPDSGTVQAIGGVFYLRQNLDYAFEIRQAANPAFNLLSQRANALSGFGQLIVRPTDALTLTLGARYTHEEKDGSLFVRKTAGQATTPGLVKDNSFDWSANVEYAFSDTLRSYVSVSRGHKAAGFLNSVAGGALTPAQLIFPGEKATNYELGLKGTIFAGDARFGLAIYNLEVDNFQSANYVPAINGFTVASRDARARGIEGNLQVRATDDLRINSSFAYNKAVFRDDKTQLTTAPEWTVTLGTSYTPSLSDTVDLDAGFDFNYKSKYPHQFDLLPGNYTPGAIGLDARVGIKLQPSQIAIALVGKNLTNERYSEFGFGYAFEPRGAAFSQQVNQPRSLALTVQLPF